MKRSRPFQFRRIFRQFSLGLLMLASLAAGQTNAQSVPTSSPTPPPVFASPHDMVFDSTGNRLYITAGGWVWRYDVPNDLLEPAYELGGTLLGIDIAPDDSFVIVAQNVYSPGHAVLHRVDLATGAVTNIDVPHLATGEASTWDVAIASNGLAFGTGRTPPEFVAGWKLRQIDLATNQVTERTTEFFSLDPDTQIQRSADRTRLFFLGTSTGGDVFTYDAVSDTFPNVPPSPFGPVFFFNTTLTNATGAVNRNGTLLAMRINISASLYSPSDFHEIHKFDGISGGLAFDAVRDRLYGVNAAKDVISGFNTMTFSEEVQIPIGENVPPVLDRFGGGRLVASPDGRYLALITPSRVRVFDVTNAPPAPSPTPTPTPTPAPSVVPMVSLSASGAAVGKGGVVAFMVSTRFAVAQPTVVNYTMSGNAVLGADYALTGTLNQVTIPAGLTSASVGLTVTTTKTKGKEKATMTLGAGSGYILPVSKRGKPKPPKATVLIRNS